MQTNSFSKKTLSKVVASTLLFASASWASAVEVQGFFSTGGGVTFDTPKLPRVEGLIADQTGRNHYLNTVSEYHKTVAPDIRGLSSRFNAHRGNTIGLQFYERLFDDISFTTQLVAKGDAENFDFNANWGFLSWNVNSDFTVRAGRLVNPLFMLSEYSNVGYAYPWVRLPAEMYSGVPFVSWSGADFSWTGYKGDWDYMITMCFGTVDQVITVGGVSDKFSVRNGVSFNTNFGNDYLRFRLGASKVDMKSSLGLDTVDAIINGTGTFYASWAVNQFDQNDGLGGATDGTVDSPDFAQWRTWLGTITSPDVEAAVGGAAALDGALSASDLGFLQASTAVGLAASISGAEPYNETTNAGGAMLKAYGQYLADLGGVSPTLGTLVTIGNSADAADVADLQAKIAIADAQANIDGAAVTAGATAVGGAGLNMADLATDSAVQAVYLPAYYASGSANANTENTAKAIYGALGALGATENSGRFNSVAQLLALSGDDVAGNYGLLQQAIKGAINETYLMEMRNYLYKTFNHNWRSGSFLSAGYTYDRDNWYSTGEYGYRRAPGYIGDQEGWYLTVGRRFGDLMPHVTLAGMRLTDRHVRSVSSSLAAGDNSLVNDWRVMLDNVQNDAAAISDVTYENIMYALNGIEDFWNYNQAYNQNSLTVGVRYDWRPGICLKVELQHLRPKLGSRGSLEPWDLSQKMTANTIALSIDAVF